MGLKEGTLELLIESGVDVFVVIKSVCLLILWGLDHIAWRGINH